MKGLFEPKLGVTFDSKETVLEVNDCTIEVYPSNHIDAYRGLDNPKFILVEEAYRQTTLLEFGFKDSVFFSISTPYN